MVKAVKAKYLTGSTMGHIVSAAAAGSLGLMSIFLIDLVDMFFISLLGGSQLAAAVGFAGTVLFFTTSIGIGLGIAGGILVSQSLGRGEEVRAKYYAMNTAIFGVVLCAICLLVLLPNLDPLLRLLGTSSASHDYAKIYLWIVLPSMPVIVVAMISSAVLRSIGDAKRGMYVTLFAGITNAVLDPIFIFALGWGLEGAAIASVCARFTAIYMGLYSLNKHYQFLVWPRWRRFKRSFKTILKIVVPSVLTNIATPVGNAFVITAMSKYGDGAIAGMAVISRVLPVAFGSIFALSGAVGPVVGQNFGAKNFDRIRSAVKDAIIFVVTVVAVMSAVLFFLQNMLALWFNASPQATSLIHFYCTWVAVTMVFSGFTFISNATFNNLGVPVYSTLLNFGKATVGTLPFVYIGAEVGGANGVLMGQSLGAFLFACIALWWLYRLIVSLEKKAAKAMTV